MERSFEGLVVPGYIDFQLCIICQTKKEDLVERRNANSHERLLVAAIKERGEYGDVKYEGLWAALQEIPPAELEERITWHRKCYQESTHSGMIKRLKERVERELAGPDESRRKESQTALLTRSKTTPYDRDVCFFCDGKARYHQPLHLVSTMSAGSSLDAAVKKLKKAPC